MMMSSFYANELNAVMCAIANGYRFETHRRKPDATDTIGISAPSCTPEEIIQTTCKVLYVLPEDIKSEVRTREFADARFIAIYFIKRVTNLTLGEIGKLFNRDHSTVIYGLDTCSDLYGKHKAFTQKFDAVAAQLNAI